MTATLFGAGELGVYVATALVASGFGYLNIVDGDVLLPGNVVRHVVGHDQVGRAKVRAVHQAAIQNARVPTVAQRAPTESLLHG